MRRLIRTLEEGRAIVGGVLSGTSADGIDVVLAEMEVDRDRQGRPKVVGCRSLAFDTRRFPSGVSGEVREALDGVTPGLGQLAILSRDLGLAFGEAAAAVAGDAGLQLDLLGSHGLTVFHHDGGPKEMRASLQIGEGDHVAEAAGCCVVSDFRQRDLAAGGEGAPISILADDVLFRGAVRPTAILNLGGMANLSWLGEGGQLLAFDTGPAGSLLDGLARALLHRPFDPDGASASVGTPVPGLLERWADHPFFSQVPPKSTGRDSFGQEWVRGLLASSGTGNSAEDLLATAVELIAGSVASGLRFLPARPEAIWLAGGGIHNRALVRALERRTELPVGSSTELGVDPDAREALVFAVLAARCVLGEPVTRTSATGAAAGRILGKISPPGL